MARALLNINVSALNDGDFVVAQNDSTFYIVKRFGENINLYDGDREVTNPKFTLMEIFDFDPSEHDIPVSTFLCVYGNAPSYVTIATQDDDYLSHTFINYNIISSGDETNQGEDIVSFISNKYEDTKIYVGMHGYHDHHGSYLNKPTKANPKYRIGIELEVEFYNRNDRDEFVDMESNWFYRERDGSLGCNGVEIITVPLVPKDAKDNEFWQPLIGAIGSKAQSWDASTCGLHVHIGREILGTDTTNQSEAMGKILYFYHTCLNDTRLNHLVYGRDRCYSEYDGKTSESSSARFLGSEVFKIKSVKDNVKRSVVSRAECSRYCPVNITNHHTIEFRKGRGTLRIERITGVIEFSELICKYCKVTPWHQIEYSDFIVYIKTQVKTEWLKGMIERYA